MLILRGVTHSYREGDRRRLVLLGIDAEIGERSFVALLGQSGSGKSTLLNLIAGLDTADSGSIIVRGLELNGLREPDRTLFRRRHIGFVYQFFNLLPTLTVLENVALPAELNGFSAAKPKNGRLRCSTRSVWPTGMAVIRIRFPEENNNGSPWHGR